MRCLRRSPLSWALSCPGRLAITLLTLLTLLGGCQSSEAPDEPDDPIRIYVGTWTGSEGGGRGIYRLDFDTTTGAISTPQPVTETPNPSYLAFAPGGQYLYSVNQTADSSSVSAFRVDETTGALTLLNTVPAGGQSPCYISIDETGQWLLVANYVSGTVAVLPVRADGSLGEATQVVQHTGSGPNPDRQEGPHAHYINVGPQNRFAFASDLGIDQVRIYPLDTERGRLDEQSVRVVETAPGSGPRHLDVHPSGEYIYVVGELDGTVTTYAYDAEAGQMVEQQTVSTLPGDFEGANKSADIHVHPSGKFLYASNRGDADSIVAYAIDPETGRLTVVGRQAEAIDWPRNFAIDPSGRYLLAANRHADRLTVYRIDPATGALSFTGHTAAVPEPMCIKFLVP